MKWCLPFFYALKDNSKRKRRERIFYCPILWRLSSVHKETREASQSRRSPVDDNQFPMWQTLLLFFGLWSSARRLIPFMFCEWKLFAHMFLSLESNHFCPSKWIGLKSSYNFSTMLWLYHWKELEESRKRIIDLIEAKHKHTNRFDFDFEFFEKFHSDDRQFSHWPIESYEVN